jgi:hypothetical protein
MLGELRKDLHWEIDFQENQKLVGYVGSRLKKAKRLEFGFVGVDKLGRMYNMAARPWLRISFEKTSEKVKSIFSTRWFE